VATTAALELRPGPAPARTLPYHRLRVLFGLEPPNLPDDQEVVDALAAPRTPASLLDALRRFAALDAIALAPAESEDGDEPLLFPAREGTPLVLAELRGLALDRDGEDWKLAGVDAVDPTVRQTLIATATLQELLCGADSPAGPRIDPASVAFADATTVTMTADRALEPASATPDGVSVSILDGTGWRTIAVASVAVDAAGTEIKVVLGADPGTGLLRLIVHGDGPAPLVGSDGVPLAEFVHMTRRT
jgi:hypothetical protein